MPSAAFTSFKFLPNFGPKNRFAQPPYFLIFFALFRPLPKRFFATWCVRGAPFFFTFLKRYGASGGTAA